MQCLHIHYYSHNSYIQYHQRKFHLHPIDHFHCHLWILLQDHIHHLDHQLLHMYHLYQYSLKSKFHLELQGKYFLLNFLSNIMFQILDHLNHHHLYLNNSLVALDYHNHIPDLHNFLQGQFHLLHNYYNHQ